MANKKIEYILKFKFLNESLFCFKTLRKIQKKINISKKIKLFSLDYIYYT